MTRKPVAPFFVIGSPRSGTSMLRLMLTNHPELVVPPECGFLLWLKPRFGEWHRTEFADFSNRALFADAIFTARKFDTWLLNLHEVSMAITNSIPANYANACDIIYHLYAAKVGKPHATWGDKNNYYLAHIHDLKALYPSARFLHIVRDGRDVACSYREVMSMQGDSPYHPSLPTSVSDIARRWSGDVASVRAQFASLKPSDQYEIHYENLVIEPEHELRQICNWLGVAFSPATLHFHEANREFGLEPLATMGWKRRTLEPANAATVGRHRRLLDQKEQSTFTAIAGAELRHYGYLS